MGLFANFIKMFKSVAIDGPKTKLFSTKLRETVERAEKIRNSILYSETLCDNHTHYLIDKGRLQIADEILCLIDDLRELQTIKSTEEKTIWAISQYHGLF